jgi:hypothetical protein
MTALPLRELITLNGTSRFVGLERCFTYIGKAVAILNPLMEVHIVTTHLEQFRTRLTFPIHSILP